MEKHFRTFWPFYGGVALYFVLRNTKTKKEELGYGEAYAV